MPQFHAWSTDFDRFKQYVKSSKTRQAEQHISFDEFFQKRLADFRQYKVPPYKLCAEVIWVKCGRPYYNLHPQIIGQLSQVDLSSIPCELIELPAQYPAINIRFCEPHPNLTLMEDMKASHSKAPARSWVHSLLMVDTRYIKNFTIPNEARNKIWFVVDFDVYDEYGPEHGNQKQPIYGVFEMSLEEGDSLEVSLNKAMTKYNKTKLSQYFQIIHNCLKLAVTVGFLASANSELLTVDVLAEYRNEYLSKSTTEERKRWIEDKSQRRGKHNGWNVGNDVMFLEGWNPHSREQTGTGKELKYAHIRTGHFHAVRYGPKHSKVKIMWFRPTIVREDLPFEKG